MELPPLIKKTDHNTQHPTMSRKKSYDEYDGSEYEDEDDKDDVMDDISADLVEVKRGTSKMKGNMQVNYSSLHLCLLCWVCCTYDLLDL